MSCLPLPLRPINFPYLLLLLTLLIVHTNSGERANYSAKPPPPPPLFPTKNLLFNNQQKEPNFIQRENENGYGLYGHESGQLPPYATGTASSLTTESEAPLHRHLPKNYNPEDYVTEPEGYTSDSNPCTENSYTNNLKNYYRDAGKSYNNQQEYEETMSEPEIYLFLSTNTIERNGTWVFCFLQIRAKSHGDGGAGKRLPGEKEKAAK